MRIERIGEAVRAHICLGVGILCRAQQRDLHNAVVDIVAILAVVHKSNAVAAVRKVSVLMRAYLEPCLIPVRVLVRGTFEAAKLDIVGRLVGKNVHRKYCLEHLVAFVPIDLSFKIDLCRVIVEPYGLLDG